jgi:hypothetical protein
MLRPLFILTLLLFQLSAIAQKKTLTALRVQSAPQIDGNLDEAAWQEAAVATGFIQNTRRRGSRPHSPPKCVFSTMMLPFMWAPISTTIPPLSAGS